MTSRVEPAAIHKLSVEEGKVVKKGDPIAEIDPRTHRLTYRQARRTSSPTSLASGEHRIRWRCKRPRQRSRSERLRRDLEAAKAHLASARARAEFAKTGAYGAQNPLTEANVESAKANLNAEETKLNQLRSAIQPQQEAAARSALDQAKANLINAEANLKRQQNLSKLGFVAPSDRGPGVATDGVYKATVESARQKVNTLKPEMDADIKAEKRPFSSCATLRTAEANGSRTI